MKPVELKVARIGNSRGVRIPASVLERYNVGDRVTMEERSDGILLRPQGNAPVRLTWEDTAQEMAQEAENWHDLEVTIADGLDDVPWDNARPSRVAEPRPTYKTGKRRRT